MEIFLIKFSAFVLEGEMLYSHGGKKPSKGVKPLNFASVVKSMDTVSLRKECSLEAFFIYFHRFFFLFLNVVQLSGNAVERLKLGDLPFLRFCLKSCWKKTEVVEKILVRSKRWHCLGSVLLWDLSACKM